MTTVCPKCHTGYLRHPEDCVEKPEPEPGQFRAARGAVKPATNPTEAAEADRVRADGLPEFPRMQGGRAHLEPMQVERDVFLAIWEAYNWRYPRLQSAKVIHERAGFGWSEAVHLMAEYQDHLRAEATEQANKRAAEMEKAAHEALTEAKTDGYFSRGLSALEAVIMKPDATEDGDANRSDD